MDGPDPEWVTIGRYRSRAEAEQHALVLAARGVVSRLQREQSTVALAVAPPDVLRAEHEIGLFRQENRRPLPPALRPLRGGVDCALIYSAILFFLYGAARRHSFGWDWQAAGLADAGRIAAGEWWRAATALGLHADLGHLAGNVAFGSWLGLLLAQQLGPGLAWLAILLAGALGNGLNASLHPPTHGAIGASTAVFAALGMLAALTWRRHATLWQRGPRHWLPFGAGAMLLTYLGFSGEQTDIGGHVAGFVVGIALGLALGRANPAWTERSGAQWALGLLALVLFGLAWWLALLSPA